MILLLKSGLTVALFFIDEESLQKFDLTGEFSSVYPY